MSERYLGEIRMFGGDYAPVGWALCQGQLLTIEKNDALFLLLGTRYGGDGVNNFALPDFRGRIPVSMGTGHGLTTRLLGQRAGEQFVTLTMNNLPKHQHRLQATSDVTTKNNPTGQVLANTSPNFYYEEVSGDERVSPFPDSVVSNYGGGRQFVNLMPSLCINFIIAVTGTYPPKR